MTAIPNVRLSWRGDALYAGDVYLGEVLDLTPYRVPTHSCIPHGPWRAVADSWAGVSSSHDAKDEARDALMKAAVKALGGEP